MVCAGITGQTVGTGITGDSIALPGGGGKGVAGRFCSVRVGPSFNKFRMTLQQVQGGRNRENPFILNIVEG